MDAFERAVKQLQAGHHAEAARTCRRIVRFAPDHADTWNILGLAEVGLGTLDEAAASFERSISLGSDADPCNNLGSLRKQQGRLDEAVAAYREALERNPDYADAHFNLGSIYRDRDELSLAAQCFDRAAATNPDDHEAAYSAGQAWFSLGQITEAVDRFTKTAAGDRAELLLQTIATIIPGDPRASNQDVLNTRRAYAKFLPVPRPRVLRERNHALRIGYISSFFHRHNWMKPVWALINRHDRERFQIHLFSDAPVCDVQHGYRAQAGDVFHDISALSNEAAADLIEQSEIDILVDLNGYSKIRRLGLCAMKPAPVLVGWFNMYATTGIDAYDYLIGDAVVIPPDEEQFYCEKVQRVSGSYLTFEVDYPVPDVAPAPCLNNGYVTFGSLASQYKITLGVIDAWASILRKLPNSRLILKNATLGSTGNRRHVLQSFGDVADRVRLEGPSDHFDFLKIYDEIDIALDTFPYNGGTTTTEAIWQGVPVLTFAGDRWASRTSASILRAAGLHDLVTASPDEYFAKAIDLATPPNRIERLSRDQIRTSLACDAESFTRNMETLYETIAR
jgi:protein O-GlcNAc transferase